MMIALLSIGLILFVRSAWRLLVANPSAHAKAQSMRTLRVLGVVLGTLLLNTLIATALTLAGDHGSFEQNLIQSQAIGITIAAACWSVTPWVMRHEGRALLAVPLYAVAIGVGTTGGLLLASVLTQAFYPDSSFPRHGLLSARTAVFSMAIGVAGTLWYYARIRIAQTRLQLEAESWRAVAAERSAAQAELQALRAQVEPHFLFNTLANVSALIERDPAAARALVDDLARHLRATLRHARAEAVPLGEELAVTTSLLAITGRRFGARLRWQVDLPAELASWPIAPMLVQPLVENAVKHGIEPLTEGGQVAVRAQETGTGELLIEVIDTGRGLEAAAAAPSGEASGIGLVNLRQRLAAIYGPQAQLTLHPNTPRGTVARLRLPTGPQAAQNRALPATGPTTPPPPAHPGPLLA